MCEMNYSGAFLYNFPLKKENNCLIDLRTFTWTNSSDSNLHVINKLNKRVKPTNKLLGYHLTVVTLEWDRQ